MSFRLCKTWIHTCVVAEHRVSEAGLNSFKSQVSHWDRLTMSPKFIWWNLISNVIEFGGEAYWRWLGPKGKLSWIRPNRSLCCPFHQVRTQPEGGPLWISESAFNRIWPYRHLDIGLQTPEPWEKNVCC